MAFQPPLHAPSALISLPARRRGIHRAKEGRKTVVLRGLALLREIGFQQDHITTLDAMLEKGLVVMIGKKVAVLATKDIRSENSHRKNERASPLLANGGKTGEHRKVFSYTLHDGIIHLPILAKEKLFL